MVRGGEEPLRPGRRGRLLRPVATTASPGSPTRAGCSCPSSADAGAGHLRHRHPGGPPPAGRRGAGAGRARRRLSPPRRTTSGLDASRVAMVLAVLQQRCRRPASAPADVYASTVGGVRLTEPAADLAVALAVASAAQNDPLAAGPGRDRRGRAGRRAAPGPARGAAAGRGRPARLHPRPGAARPGHRCPTGIRGASTVADVGHALLVGFPAGRGASGSPGVGSIGRALTRDRDSCPSRDLAARPMTAGAPLHSADRRRRETQVPGSRAGRRPAARDARRRRARHRRCATGSSASCAAAPAR